MGNSNEYIKIDDRFWCSLRNEKNSNRSLAVLIPVNEDLNEPNESLTIIRYSNLIEMSFDNYLADFETTLQSRIFNGNKILNVDLMESKKLQLSWSVQNDLILIDQQEFLCISKNAGYTIQLFYTRKGKLIKGTSKDSCYDLLNDVLLNSEVLLNVNPKSRPTLASFHHDEFESFLEISKPNTFEVIKWLRTKVQSLNAFGQSSTWAYVKLLLATFLISKPHSSESVGALEYSKRVDEAIISCRRALEFYTDPQMSDQFLFALETLLDALSLIPSENREINLLNSCEGLEFIEKIFLSTGNFEKAIKYLVKRMVVTWTMGELIDNKFFSKAIDLLENYNNLPNTSPVNLIKILTEIGEKYLELGNNIDKNYYFVSIAAADIASHITLQANIEKEQVTEFIGYRGVLQNISASSQWGIYGFTQNQMENQMLESIKSLPPEYNDHFLYLRPLKSSRRIFITNYFSRYNPKRIELPHEPNIITLESALHRALSMKFLGISVGGFYDAIGLGCIHDLNEKEWKGIISKYIHFCRFLLVIVSDSIGLKWEIELIIREKLIKKLVLIMPPDSKQSKTAKYWKESQLVMREFGITLSEYKKDGGFILFTDEGKVDKFIEFDTLWKGTLVGTLDSYLS